MWKFNGPYEQVVTELGKAYEPGKGYELTDSERDLLTKRGFFSLFTEEKQTTKKEK